jgi:hypothetical protein
MDNSFFEKLFSDWSKTYYTEPVLTIFSLMTIILGIKNYRKEKIYTFFIVYSISCFFLILISGVLRVTFPINDSIIIIETGNTLFEFIELSVFYYFFLQIINSNVVRLVMKFSFITFLILVILFLVKITDQNFNKNQVIQFSTLIGSIKFFLFLIPIFTYFFELFINDPVKDIFHGPSLWITSGLFLYCLATLPFLLISDSLHKSDKSLYFLMFSIHFLSLSFLFLTIIKAFVCRRPITT